MDTVVAQVEFYFSDENLPGDKFLQQYLKEGQDGMVPLAAVSHFKKMKKLLRKIVGNDSSVDGQCEVLAQSLRALSSKVHVSEDGKP